MKNKSNTIIVLLALVIPSIAIAATPSTPDTGSDDCYNRATKTCNRTNPGGNMGDANYRNCINDLLDWCDINEPVESGLYLPLLNSKGRFVNNGLFVDVTPPKRNFSTPRVSIQQQLFAR